MSDIRRKSNFEWLRVLAMGMVITLHFMFKGGIIVNPTEDFGLRSVVLWLVTSFCICAVNAYVLISGYFLVEAEFKISRLAGLIIQVMEYSLIVYVLLVVIGVDGVTPAANLHELLGYIFPIGTGEYWFVTAYFYMYLVSPMLAQGIKKLDRKTLRILIAVLLFFTCIEKSILPMLLPGDAYGYDFIWFMMLFVIAAYIRLYGIEFLEGHTGRAWMLYAGSALLIWIIGLGFSYAGYTTGIKALLHYSDIVFHYNYIFVLTSSVGLFYIFRNASFNEDGIPARAARILGHLTLGVYLLHEHPCVRYNWPKWLGVRTDGNLGATLVSWLMCLVIIYAVGLLVEYLRTVIHSYIASAWNSNHGQKKTSN
ncbi:MAG: acyltransferase [Lachnospiraceae bacterium]|nr:acyltransferase [Lachnospiraceae bacterium]